MHSVLITILAAAAATLVPFAVVEGAPAPIIVLVANGSDITINLSGDGSHNRVLSVVSDSGNNNPSMVDWVGGNGANKAPRLTVGTGGGGGGEQKATGNGAATVAAMIDALWKSVLAEATPATTTTTVVGSDYSGSGNRDDESGETKEVSFAEGGDVFDGLNSSASGALKDATTKSYSRYLKKVTQIDGI